VDPEHGLECLSSDRVGVDRVHQSVDDRDAGERADRIRAGEDAIAHLHVALPIFHGLGAEHQVREVQVPFVRRHVGTLGHVAQIAEITVVDHLPVVVLGDAVDLHRFGLVHQIEQRREGLAEADAAATAVTDVEDALQLLVERSLVVEISTLPVERVTGRGFETPLPAH
jgi:hypothetical protein